MLFYWIVTALRKIAWLFRPVSARDVARIDANDPCPTCGHRQGRLRAVTLSITAPGATKIPMPKVFCQHTSAVCGGRWYEDPVVAVSANYVWRSMARDEIEQKEDLFWATYKGGQYIESKNTPLVQEKTN